MVAPATTVGGLRRLASLEAMEPTTPSLARFVLAQDLDGTYDSAVAELRRGRKVGHWIWFVFPQLAGLGTSANAQHFGLTSLEEASRYLDHRILGPRMRECTTILLGLDTDDPVAIFGGLDATKLRSSMTLFHRARPDEPLFGEVLDRFYGGAEDPLTVARLES